MAWDVDGTLIDSEPIHLRALLSVCRDDGIDLSDLPDNRFVGVALPEVWDELRARYPAGAAPGREAWMGRINIAYLTEVVALRQPEDAARAIGRLHALGLPQVAVSNSNREIVEANLRALGVAELLRFSVTLDDVARPKPDPEPYRLAAKRLRLPPGAVVAIEDSAAGEQSALSSGCRVISLRPGARRSLSLAPPGELSIAPSLGEAVGLVAEAARAAATTSEEGDPT